MHEDQHDLVTQFHTAQSGQVPIHCPTNADMEEPDLSFKLDPTYLEFPQPRYDPVSYEIENGVPLPSKHDPFRTDEARHELINAMAHLRVGQSFFVPFGNLTYAQLVGRIGNIKKGLRGLYALRKAHKDGSAGVRIWKVADDKETPKTDVGDGAVGFGAQSAGDRPATATDQTSPEI